MTSCGYTSAGSSDGGRRRRTEDGRREGHPSLMCAYSSVKGRGLEGKRRRRRRRGRPQGQGKRCQRHSTRGRGGGWSAVKRKGSLNPRRRKGRTLRPKKGIRCWGGGGGNHGTGNAKRTQCICTDEVWSPWCVDYALSLPAYAECGITVHMMCVSL